MSHIIAEPFHDWFEQKMDLEMFECISPVEIVAPPPQPPMKQTMLPPLSFTQQQQTVLLQQQPQITFDFQLTPPQSPPNLLQQQQTYDIVTELANLQPEQQYQFQYVQQQPTFITLMTTTEAAMKAEEIALSAPPTPIPDLDRELAAVDELVRTRAQDLDSNWDQDQWECETTMSSSCSSSGSESSPPRSTTTEDEDDPEWVPSPVNTLQSKNKMVASKSTKRSKPYVRTTNLEDKKLRKKEQNKTAATRYRQKKKAEVGEIQEEERLLQEDNEKLQQEANDISREIKYLKSLMLDLLKAKE